MILRFHNLGLWRPGDVQVRWTPSTHRLPPGAAEFIDRKWSQVLAQPGVKLFDGPMCRLESFTVEHGRVTLSLSQTSYRIFVGTNLYHADLADRYGWESLANPVGVSSALISADDHLMMGRRNQSVAYYPQRIHPFAGALEPNEKLDVFQEVRRELGEELAFGNDDIADIHLCGLVEDVSLRQPELIFMVRSARSKARIESQVDRKEHHESWSIPADQPSIEATLQAPHLLTPIAIATLLLWGGEQFGQAWFDRASRPFTA